MMDETVKYAILEAILSREKIQAIKQLREASGLGLADAKALVERIDECLMRDGLDSPEAARLLDGAGAPSATVSIPKEVAPEVEEAILELLRDGKTIEAIKVYRGAQGGGLKDAKDAVDAMARSAGIPVRSGCAGILFMSITAAVFFAVLIRELLEAFC